MLTRLVAVAAAVVSTCVLVACSPPNPVEQAAEKLLGERWYVVQLLVEPVGHYRTHARRTATGDWEFGTEMAFRLGAAPATVIAETLVFDAVHPHGLKRAVHSKTQGEGSPLEQASIVREGDQLIAQARGGRRIALERSFTLAHYVGLEAWLAAEPRMIDEAFTLPGLDFDRLAIIEGTWRIASRDSDGRYTIRSDNRHDGNEVLLDEAFAPERLTLSDVFIIERVADQDTAQAWDRSDSLFHSDEYVIPIDTELVRPKQLTRLVLSLETDREDVGPWNTLVEAGHVIVNDSDTKLRIDAGDEAAERRETVHYPTSATSVRRLAARVTRGLDDPLDQVHALTQFVNRYVRYADTPGVQSVVDTIHARTGDCTDYANLMTTLARATGIPARTVIGLAYNEEASSFGLHAWNEVGIDGWWIAVDPTWGQTTLDATHLRLPEGNAIASLLHMPSLRFRLIEASHAI